MVDNNKVIFESYRIYFCKISEDFIDDYLKMVNNPEISNKISRHNMKYSRYDEINWIRTKLAQDDKIFTMVDKETNKFIGNIEIMHIENNSAEIGICITEDMQGKHFGTEAMQAIVDYCYNILNLETVYLNVFDFNTRAIKCYQNVEFEIDGPGNPDGYFHMTHRR